MAVGGEDGGAGRVGSADEFKSTPVQDFDGAHQITAVFAACSGAEAGGRVAASAPPHASASARRQTLGVLEPVRGHRAAPVLERRTSARLVTEPTARADFSEVSHEV